MKKYFRAWLPLGAALAGCGQGSGPDAEVERRAVTAGLCAGTRYIAYLTGSTPCDELAGLSTAWQLRPLFAPKPWESAAPGRLSRYCVAEWTGSGNGAPPPPDAILRAEAAAALPEGTVLDRDCASLQPQGVAETHWGDLRADFLTAAGRLEGFSGPAPAPTPVTFVDSWPDARGAAWTRLAASSAGAATDHGYALARVAEELTCPTGLPGLGCLLDVRARRAFERDPALSLATGGSPGTHGYLTELAAAVYGALRVDDTAAGPLAGPHVLNLSLGWAPLPVLGGAIGDVELGERAAAGAVHEVLQYAACRGALTFAAAGNDLGGQGGDDDGAVYPAAWTTHEALDASSCALEFGWSSTPTQRPLVQAVGAVHADGRTFALARAGSEPALVAFGLHGVARREAGAGSRTALLTGTSVASAVVSAAAGAVWSAAPTLDADAVLDAVHLGGQPTGRAAALHDGVRADVRHVELCKAVERACAGPVACGAAYRCPAPTADRFDPSTIALAPRSGSASACRPPTSPFSTVTPVCGAGLHSTDDRPHVVPQPGDVVCTVCFAKHDASLGELTAALEMKSSVDARPDWLYVEDGAASYAFDLTGHFPSLLGSGVLHSAEVGGLRVSGSGPFTAKLYFELSDSSGDRVTTATELPVY